MGRKKTAFSGEYLKKARESKKMSIAELSRKTQLSPELLLAMEENRFEFFSQPEFIPGYLRLYARQLGLDEDEALREDKAFGQIHEDAKKSTPIQTNLFLDYNPPIRATEQTKKTVFRNERNLFKHTFLILFMILILSLFFYIPAEYKGPNEIRSDTFRVVEMKKGIAPASPVVQEPGKMIEVIGNRDSKRYHLPGMKYYHRVDAYHRVVFTSEEEAVKAGYHKAPR